MRAPIPVEFEAEWRARFERFARRYEDEALISGWSAAGLRRRVQLFTSLLPSLRLPPGSHVLDLGCGAGTYVRLLAERGHRAVGLDYSLPSLGRAREADPHRRACYLAGEAYALPFSRSTFGLVVCIGVLQALADPAHAIAEMTRVLRPDGTLIVEALNARGLIGVLKEATHRLGRQPPRVRGYPPREVAGWLRARGLRVEATPGLCLPPRRWPALGRILETDAVEHAFAFAPGLSRLIAHSFLFVARRDAASTESAR
jgi:ubiquinone/menaquinone biosynthesis C-methylase UbiE